MSLSAFTAPPNIAIDEAGWFQWAADRVAEFYTNCPEARGTTHHFANDGDDVSGDGSEANPFATIAKAQALLNAASSPADMRLRFKRGDVFTEAGGLRDTKGGVTIDAYGDAGLNRPLFNRFTVQYPASGGGWTLLSGTTYFRSESNDIAWVRRISDRTGDALKRVTNSSEVAANVNSFLWDSGSNSLLINIGVDPNTVDIEAVISNTDDGVSLEADGSRCANVDAHGHGCHRTTTAPQTQPFSNKSSGNNANLFLNCDGYYSGSHVIAHYLGSGSGGRCVFDNCTAGYTKKNGSGETVFNTFSSTGGQETWFIDPECFRGTLPSIDWVTGTSIREGVPLFGHTGSGAVGLVVAIRGRWHQETTWGVRSAPRMQDAPSAASLPDARVFFVHDRFIEPITVTDHGASYMVLGEPGQVRYGIDWRGVCYPTGTAAMSNRTAGGWLINSYVKADLSNITGSWGFYNSATTNDPKYWHCQFDILNYNAANTFGIDWDNRNLTGGSGQSDAGELKNCILNATGTGTIRVAFNNIAGQQSNNAYFGFTQSSDVRGWDNDAGAVQPSAMIPFGSFDPQLRGAGAAGLNVSHDIIRRLRDTATPDIGPFSLLPQAHGGGEAARTAALMMEDML